MKNTATPTVTMHNWRRSPYKAVQNTGSKATTATPEFAPPVELRRNATAARKITEGRTSLALPRAPRQRVSRTKPARTPNPKAAAYCVQVTVVPTSATSAANPADAANGARFSAMCSPGSIPSMCCSSPFMLNLFGRCDAVLDLGDMPRLRAGTARPELGQVPS